MRCIDKTELGRFLTGDLPVERLLVVGEHVSSCAKCRAALLAMPGASRVYSALGMRVMGLEDCPDYESLSAFVDNECPQSGISEIQSHINACEECSRDVARMRELRSHASIRDRVTVRPGSSVTAARPVGGLWKRVLAGVGAAAVSAGLVFGVAQLAHQPAGQAPSVVSVPAPPVNVRPSAPEAQPPVGSPKTSTAEQSAAAKPEHARQPEPRRTSSQPTYTTVMVDGDYRVIEKDGRRVLAGRDGKPLKLNLDARAQAAIDEKLNTGKVKQPEPMVVAWNVLRSRPTRYTPPVTAPKLVSPVGQIIVETTPTLKWTAVDMAHSYRVIVSDSEGNRIVDRVTDDTSLTLSEPLERGKVYLWLVGVKFTEGDVWSDSGAARFKVLSEEGYAAIEAVKRQLPGSRLALGAVYESLGLYDEAAEQYRALAKQNPHSADVNELLNGIPEVPR